MAIDRNETFDVIVVGAGPAGSAAALRLAEQRVKVLLIERGTAPGAKNMMGGRIYTHSLERLVPDFRDRAPLERKVTKERISIGAGNEMTTIEYSYEDGQPNEESYVVCLLYTSISNTVVKLINAESTWLETAWEDRKPLID